MPEGLKFSMEELHEMYKRMILNGFFAKEQEQGFVSVDDADIICDNAMRMLKAMDSHGLCKE